MGSALLNTEAADLTLAGPSGDSRAAAGWPDAEALRLQVAERLAAHRSRRGGAPAQPASREPARTANTRSARIAAAVAERYAHTQSYRAFLAAEAERAIQQARAAAEVAAQNALAVAAAQQRLLDAFDDAESGAPCQTASWSDMGSQPHDNLPHELNLWPEFNLPAPHKARRTPAADPHQEKSKHQHAQPSDPGPRSNPELRASNLGPLTVRLYEDSATTAHIDLEHSRRAATIAHPEDRRGDRGDRNDRNEAEARALDEEIAFRRAPVFEEPAGPPVPLPANLIEFPRQLVAARKVRPRYAEGPLREQAAAAPASDAGQLRIFEVDPAQISTKPADTTGTPAPQWTSIWLDTQPQAAALAYAAPDEADDLAQPAARAVPPLQPASIGRRVLAASINAAILLAALAAFAIAVVAVASHTIPGRAGLSLHAAILRTGLPLNLAPAALAGTGALLFLLYQALFFWLSVATPGMRCARIAFCTFDDENPSRAAVRRRIFAVLLSACPLGLGFLWAAMDEERLSWHDRLCRIYQRSY